MLIQREDIDPQTLDKLLAGIGEGCAKTDPTPEEQRARRKAGQRLGAPLDQASKWLLGSIGYGGISYMAVFSTPEPEWAVLSGIAVFLVTSVIGFVKTAREMEKRAETIHPDLLKSRLPLLKLTRAERAYCETLILLFEKGTRLDAPTVQETLRQLNTLMAHSRQLDSQRTELAKTAGTESMAELEAERVRLQEKSPGRKTRRRAPICKRALNSARRVYRARVRSRLLWNDWTRSRR
jgi:hypothetical protein